MGWELRKSLKAIRIWSQMIFRKRCNTLHGWPRKRSTFWSQRPLNANQCFESNNQQVPNRRQVSFYVRVSLKLHFAEDYL